MASSSKVFCAGSLEAQQLPDEEFWDRVFNPYPEEDPDYDPYIWAEHNSELGFEEELHNYTLYTYEGELVGYSVIQVIAPEDACSVCGSVTACGYDSDGRAMIHAQGDWE